MQKYLLELIAADFKKDVKTKKDQVEYRAFFNIISG